VIPSTSGVRGTCNFLLFRVHSFFSFQITLLPHVAYVLLAARLLGFSFVSIRIANRFACVQGRGNSFPGRHQLLEIEVRVSSFWGSGGPGYRRRMRSMQNLAWGGADSKERAYLLLLAELGGSTWVGKLWRFGYSDFCQRFRAAGLFGLCRH
jgi:hypothetical protein